MKKIIFSISLLFIILPVGMASTIRGKVVDATSQQPLGFVKATLIVPGSANMAAGVTTDDNGILSIPDVKPGQYTLQLSFMGYHTASRSLSVSEKDINLGIIKLVENTKQLKEIEVVGQGTQMKFDIDKKVFSVDQNIAASGGSASDVLRNIPAVKVDNEGNVSLRKDGNVEVWINGKPSGLTADNRAQVLQQMPAGSIESVEVMTNPSAKYNPEGTAGIINLVMKKKRQAGYFGSVSAGAMYPDGGKVTPNIGANINYSSSKVDAYANIGYRAMSFAGGNLNTRYNLNGTDTTTILSQDGRMTNAFSGIFARAGIDYHIDTLNTISLSGFGMAGSGISDNYTTYNLTDWATGSTLKNYVRDNHGTGTRPSLNLNLDYKHEFSKDANLMASLSYSKHTRSGDNNITQLTDVIKTYDINQKMVGTNNEMNFKVDYTNKFSSGARLEAGWQSTASQRNSFTSAKNNLAGGSAILEYNNDFYYSEQNHAAYATYGNRYGNFSYQGGLRAEYLMRESLSKSPLAPDTTISYEPKLQLFPSLYLSYTLPKNNEMQLNLTRRVNRPRGRQINPFKDYSDSTNISYGNPLLLPQYTTALEFNYIKTWDQHSLSASAYYRFTDNQIEDVHFIHNNTMESTYMNIARLQNSGLEVVAKDRLFKMMNLTTTVNLYQSKLFASTYINPYDPSIVTTIPEQSTFTWSANVMANFMLSRTLSGQITAEYSAPTLIAQGYESPEYQVDFGLRKTFFERKLIVGIMAQDLFNFNRERTTTWGNGFYQNNESYFHRRMLGLTLTYNFGNMKPRQDQKKKGEGMDMNMEGGME